MEAGFPHLTLPEHARGPPTAKYRARLRGPVAVFRRAELALLLLLALLWGTAFAFISLGLEYFSPVFFAALRFDLAGSFLLATALLRGRAPLLPSGPRQWLAVVIAGALMTGAYHAFLFWGQRETTASVAAVIVGLSPLLTVGFSRLLLHDDRVGVRGLLGLVLGFAGIVLLASLKEGSLLDARGVGELLVVAAIASWALGSVLVKRTGHGMDTVNFAAWQTVVGAVLLHTSALLLEGGGRASAEPAALLALVYLAIVSSGFGFLIYFTLIQRVGPIRVNLVSNIAPVFATLAGVSFLDQPLELRAMLAFALIALGFSMVVLAPGSRPEDPRGVRP